MTKKQKVLTVVLSAVLVGIIALPTDAAQETLSGLAVKVKAITAKVANLNKNGKLAAKHVTYANKKSGLKATNVQAALDEVGTTLSEALSKGTVSAAGVRATSLSSSIWKGNYYTAGDSSDLAKPSSEVTVTFTPTTATAGTFTSESYYAFAPIGGGLKGTESCVISSPYPTGTFSGKYEIVGDQILYTHVTSSTAAHADCRQGNKPVFNIMHIKGNQIIFQYFGQLPPDLVVLTRQ